MRQRAETNTQRTQRSNCHLAKHMLSFGVTLLGRYSAFAADWHNRPHELATSDDVSL